MNRRSLTVPFQQYSTNRSYYYYCYYYYYFDYYFIFLCPPPSGVEEVGQTDSDYKKDKRSESLVRSDSERNTENQDSTAMPGLPFCVSLTVSRSRPEVSPFQFVSLSSSNLSTAMLPKASRMASLASQAWMTLAVSTAFEASKTNNVNNVDNVVVDP